MNFEDRVKAVAEFAFTERQSRFLVTVMLYVWNSPQSIRSVLGR